MTRSAWLDGDPPPSWFPSLGDHVDGITVSGDDDEGWAYLHFESGQEVGLPIDGRRAQGWKAAAKMVRLYHISPEADLQRFRGTVSPKHKAKGLFVAPLRAIWRSWADYVAGKKHPRGPSGYPPAGSPAQVQYRNLTLYALDIPADVVQEARRRHRALAEAAFAAKEDSAYGAWAWDVELFIPAEFLPRVRITGRKTYPREAFLRGQFRQYLTPEPQREPRNLAEREWVRLHERLGQEALRLTPEAREAVRRGLKNLHAIVTAPKILGKTELSPGAVRLVEETVREIEQAFMLPASRVAARWLHC